MFLSDWQKSPYSIKLMDNDELFEIIDWLDDNIGKEEVDWDYEPLIDNSHIIWRFTSESDKFLFSLRWY